jgi:hypothetical protein
MRRTIVILISLSDIENWYEALKCVTYATEFEPITVEEGKAMVMKELREYREVVSCR